MAFLSRRLAQRTITVPTVAGPVAAQVYGGAYGPKYFRKAGTLEPISLQERYGPEYVKKGFKVTPLDILAPALNIVAPLIPGASTVTGLIGGTGGMDGGFGDVGLGLGNGSPCPTGTYCKGVPISTPIGSTCLGSCVPYSGATLPGVPGTPGIGPIYEGNGQVIVAGKRKRRRMNYSNQRALRRALRRATGYVRQQKAIRKAAGEFAREFGPKTRRPRRDLGRGHVHVR